MKNKTIELLEFDKIIEILKGYAISDIAKERLQGLEPEYNINVINRNLNETTEARNIINVNSSIPIHSLKEIVSIMDKVHKGGILHPEELEVISGLLRETSKLKRFMENKQQLAETISSYALSASELQEVKEEIDRCIVYGRVDDKASSALSKIRKKIHILEERIKSKLEAVLQDDRNRNYLQDSLISQRNGRYVIPVKSEYKNNVSGDIHDRSNSNHTVFIEPAGVKKAQDELNLCLAEEEREVFRILSTLTNLVEENERQLNINIEVMSYYDFVFAKAKYSRSIEGNSVSFNSNNFINIKNGRHPLLGKNSVPLNLTMGDEYRAVVITGPNTGGKTVALKTVGLLTLMAQSGLHIPVEEGSELAIFADVLVDIGDGQSIEQNLSTFSSHVNNIIEILSCADEHSLVILDEIGAGTDPGEGMGIAVAVLENIYNKGAVLLATTHYSEIKDFAMTHKGFVNGCMEFDLNTLKPLYKLNIGKPGESNAFLIALRLGMDSNIIERAHEVTYHDHKDYSGYASDYREIRRKSAEAVELHEKQLKQLEAAEKSNRITQKQKEEGGFKLGDSVYISFMDRTGIIYEGENSKGEYGVIVMKKKLKINKKRLKLYINSSELYPENYDFDIIFESAQNRKKEKLMNKRHVEGLQIVIKEEN